MYNKLITDSNAIFLIGSKMQCIQKRYLVTFLSFLGQFVMFLVRVNIGIAVVAMTSDQTVTIGNETKITVSLKAVS